MNAEAARQDTVPMLKQAVPIWVGIEEAPAVVFIDLREGTRIMVTRNHDHSDLVNGTRGGRLSQTSDQHHKQHARCHSFLRISVVVGLERNEMAWF